MRYHLVAEGRQQMTVTVEGFEIGVADGHYLAVAARHVQAAEQTVPLDGVISIPRERVLFRQVLAENAL